MALSDELISQFAKVVNKDSKQSSETTVYGTVVTDGNGNKYVKLDGSDQLTPLSDDERPSADSTTANANAGERVSVLIKDHSATVTGNISSPSVRSEDFNNLEDDVTDIKKFDIVIAEQVQANEGYIKKLQTDKANVGDLTAATARITELETKKASVEELNAAKAEITDLKTTKIDADVANAKFATIENLDATNADINNLETNKANVGDLTAATARITELETKKLSAEQAEIRFANIDFTNITEAAITKLFTDSGIIKDLVVSEGHITGELIGVTIKGDLIEGGTVKADRLVIKGSDGLFYKLNTDGITTSAEQTEYNSLSGTVITAKTITAEKVNVDDLVAFGATIGGFKITNESLYSGVKSSVDNTTRGIYIDKNGQLAVGDSDHFFKYYQDEDGSYKLAISADSIHIQIGDSQKSVETVINDAVDDLNDSLSKNINDNVKALEDNATSINDSINNLDAKVNDNKEEVDGKIANINNKLDLQLTEESVEVVVRGVLDDGVKKVQTDTGFKFDDEGLQISKSGSQTSTQITDNGMAVENAETGDTMLTANKDGVDATNLKATTYLIVGGRSRFENYGTDRTGCFWIGG